MLPEPIISIEWGFWDILRNQSQDLDYSDSNHATHRTEIHKLFQRFGTQDTRTAMAVKTLLKKWIPVLSIFIVIIPTYLLVPANFLGVEFWKATSKFKKNIQYFIMACLSPP